MYEKHKFYKLFLKKKNINNKNIVYTCQILEKEGNKILIKSTVDSEERILDLDEISDLKPISEVDAYGKKKKE